MEFLSLQAHEGIMRVYLFMVMNHVSASMEEYVKEIARLLVELHHKFICFCHSRGEPLINGSINGSLVLFVQDPFLLLLL